MKIRHALLSLVFLMMTGVLFGQSEWNFDKAHTKIQFAATHMKISEVNGQFKDFRGSIMTNGEDFSNASIKVIIDAASVDTDNERRDGHLKSEAFLAVEEYPNIKFVGESMEKVGEKKYKLKGRLTIRDVTQTETFDVKYMGTVEAMGATRVGFKVTGTIDRFDYNVDWDKSFGHGLIVGTDIKITADVELTKAE